MKKTLLNLVGVLLLFICMLSNASCGSKKASNDSGNKTDTTVAEGASTTTVSFLASAPVTSFEEGIADLFTVSGVNGSNSVTITSDPDYEGSYIAQIDLKANGKLPGKVTNLGYINLILLKEDGTPVLDNGEADMSLDYDTYPVLIETLNKPNPEKITLKFDGGVSDATLLNNLLSQVKYAQLYISSINMTESADDSEATGDYNPYNKTLSEFGVTYECKYDPKDNDAYIASYDNNAVMQDKDEIIKAWQIMEEENLRYIMAAGENGIDNPDAFARNQKFKRAMNPNYKSDDSNPIGYMGKRLYNYKRSNDFSETQKKNISDFKEKYDAAYDAWRKAKK